MDQYPLHNHKDSSFNLCTYTVAFARNIWSRDKVNDLMRRHCSTFAVFTWKMGKFLVLARLHWNEGYLEKLFHGKTWHEPIILWRKVRMVIAKRHFEKKGPTANDKEKLTAHFCIFLATHDKLWQLLFLCIFIIYSVSEGLCVCVCVECGANSLTNE